jgi:hypothetical protein
MHSAESAFRLVDDLLHLLLDLSGNLVGLPLRFSFLSPVRALQLPSRVPLLHRIFRSPLSILLCFIAVVLVPDDQDQSAT